MSRPFAPATGCCCVDAKRRRYLVTLADGRRVPHPRRRRAPRRPHRPATRASTVRSTTGARYTAVRPTLADFVLEMPRGAQVIYPKDLGPILCWPTSSRAPGCSSPGSARARCR